MNFWFSQTVAQDVGWTLVHFLWQGLVIGTLLAVGLRLMRRAPAHHRYLAGCAALLLMALAPLVTFQILMKPDEPAPIPALPAALTARSAQEFVPRPANSAEKPTIVVSGPAKHEKTASYNFESLLPWIAGAWLAGVLALTCRLFAGWLQVRRLRRTAVEFLDEPWQEKLGELARRLGVNRSLRLLQSACVEVPTVIGWLRPVILLPVSCLTGLAPAQLESILAHELAHIRRHDYLINLLQSAVETLLFYHPAVWWVSRRIREEREHCCDDLAVGACGDRVGYARALATLEELRLAPAQLTLAAGGAPLLQRIRRLLGQAERNASQPVWPLAGMLLAMLVVFLAIGLRNHRAMAGDNKPQITVSAKPEAKQSAGTDKPQSLNQGAALITPVISLQTAASNDDFNSLYSSYQIPDSKFSLHDRAEYFWESGGRGAVAGPGKAPELTGKVQYDLWQDVFSRLKLSWDNQADAGPTTSNRDRSENAKDSAIRPLTQVKPGTNVLQRDLKPKPNLFNRTNIVRTGTNIYSKAEIMAKLNSIRDSVQYPDPDQSNNAVSAISSGQSNKPSVNTLVQDGRLLYELGRFEEAEKKLKLALEEEPENIGAVQYLQMINEARYLAANTKSENYDVRSLAQVEQTTNVLQRDPQLKPKPNAFNRTNVVRTGGPGKADIMAKLNSIRDSVQYPELPLKDVLSDLARRAKELDPEKKGINFFIEKETGPPAGVAADGTTTGGAVVDLNDVKVTVSLKDASLGQILDAITKTADAPVKYSILEYAVMFSFRRPEAVPLETRVFHVDPNTFQQGLQNVTGVPAGNAAATAPVANGAGGPIIGDGRSAAAGDALQAQVQNFLIAGGIDLATNNNSGKSVFYNDRKGILVVHATAADLDLVENAVENLNRAWPDTTITTNIFARPTNSPSAILPNRIIAPKAAAPATLPDEPLETRIFQFDPNALRTGLEGSVSLWSGNSQTNPDQIKGSETLPGLLMRYLAAIGVNIDASRPGNEGKTLIFNDRKGVLIVRANAADLAMIDVALQTIAQSPPQVNIAVKFVEIEPAPGVTNTLESLLGNVEIRHITNTPGRFILTETMLAPAPDDSTNSYQATVLVSNSVALPTAGLLTDPQFRLAIKAMNQRNGVERLTLPQVTTESGRQAQIQSVEAQTIVLGPKMAKNKAGASATNQFATVPMFFGPMLDVIPYVSGDEFNVRLKFTATITEFVGYDGPPKFVSLEKLTNGIKLTQPRFRTRQVTNDVVVWDGETVVIGGIVTDVTRTMKDKVPVLGDVPLMGGLFRSTSVTTAKKHLLIFITPTIINPDGTRYHSDEEMPFLNPGGTPRNAGQEPPKK